MSDAPYPEPAPPPPAAPPPRTPWAQLAVTVVILLLWATTVLMEAFGMPALGEGTRQLIETAVTLVIGYHLGSSAGSAARAETMDRLAGVLRR